MYGLVVVILSLPLLLQVAKCIEPDNELNDIEDIIPGKAGLDYPVLHTVATTKFRCSDYNFAGYFADTELGCQGYHICFPDGRNASFLCVNGTVFNQRYFVCDWWFHFDCSIAPLLYELNLFHKPKLPNLPPIIRKNVIKLRKPTDVPRPLSVRHAKDCFCPCLNETLYSNI